MALRTHSRFPPPSSPLPPGIAKKLEGSALFKARLDNTGVVSLLYEQASAKGEQEQGSGVACWAECLLVPMRLPRPAIDATTPSLRMRTCAAARPPRPAPQEVRAKTRMGLSAQLDALALDKAPKLGFAYDLKY